MNSPARQVAEQIAALINSRPVSPRVDELEAIAASVMTCQNTSARATTPAPAVLEWHRHLADGDRKWMDPDANLSEEEWNTLLGDEVRRSHQAFAHHDEDDQAELRKLLAKTDSTGMDEQSLAHLLKAICTMGGFAPGEIPTGPVAVREAKP
jgi:hypothetical protein